MTEAEWLESTDLGPMLEFLRDKASERKLRLFAVACCRRIWGAFDPRSSEAIEIAEGFADGSVSPEGLAQAFLSARDPEEARFAALFVILRIPSLVPLLGSPENPTPNFAEAHYVGARCWFYGDPAPQLVIGEHEQMHGEQHYGGVGMTYDDNVTATLAGYQPAA